MANLRRAYEVVGDYDPLAALAWPFRVLIIFVGVVSALFLVPAVIVRLSGDASAANPSTFVAFCCVLFVISRQLARVHFPSADAGRLRYLSFVYRAGALTLTVLAVYYEIVHGG